MLKQNYLKKAFVVFSLLTFISGKSAFSEETKSENSGPTVKKSWQISLGLGAAFKNNIRKDNNDSGKGGDVIIMPVPMLQVAWGPISLGQQGVNAHVYGNREIGASINFNQAGDRYFATGMEAKRESWMFGAGFKYYKLSFLVAKDITGRSKGAKVSLHYTELYPLSQKVFTRSSVGLECYDQKFAEYYYGVKTNEVAPTRSEYHPNHYCLPTLSFFPGYKLDKQLSIMSGFSFKGLSKEIRRSPTTTGTWLEGALIIGGLWAF